jgi:putative endonuclease
VSGRITRIVLRLLDRISPARTSEAEGAPHRRTGQLGEEEAYFYLRRRGYVMVAKNYRSPRHHGEIDLVGWDRKTLCFIEVKTRTTRDVKPAEAAVDREKRRALRKVVRDYLQSLPKRQFPEPPPWRFDVLTVYYELASAAKKEDSDGRPHPRRHLSAVPPTFELFQNAALSA